PTLDPVALWLFPRLAHSLLQDGLAFLNAVAGNSAIRILVNRSPINAARNRATSTHGHWTKRSDPGLANSGLLDYVANGAPIERRQPQPSPLAPLDVPILLAGQRPLIKHELRWPSTHRGQASHSC